MKRPIALRTRAHSRQQMVCTECNGASWIKRDGEGYRITCIGCGKTAWGSHASLLGVLSK